MGNEGILYVEASENKATVTFSHIRNSACMYQKVVGRYGVKQSSPVQVSIYLGMAGHSHIPKFKEKSTDEQDCIGH